MADAITYADLRFVKVPLKNNASNHLGQDCEAYEDGELTYENVSPVPGGPPGLVSPALADKAGVRSEQPTASWSSVKSSALGQILRCPTVCLQYSLLGLLLACLMLGVAIICLGVRYLQVSQQFQQVSRILEATNSSLQQQLREEKRQLKQREEALRESRRELNSTQDTFQEKQKMYELTKQQLQDCQAESQRTKESLKTEEQRRQDLDQSLRNTRDVLRRLFSCSSDTCCPRGWVQHEKRCFYISCTPRSLEESRKYCMSLSSKLAAFNDPDDDFSPAECQPPDIHLRPEVHRLTPLPCLEVSLPDGLKELLDRSKSYWIEQMSRTVDYPQTMKWRSDYYSQSSYCCLIKYHYQLRKWERSSTKYRESRPCICELEAIRFPDGIHLN